MVSIYFLIAIMSYQKYILSYFDEQVVKLRYFDKKPKPNKLRNITIPNVHFNFYEDDMYDLSNFNIILLELGREFDGNFKAFPNSLKYLHFDDFSFFNEPLLSLPSRLMYLSIGFQYDKRLNLCGLSKLETLILGAKYDHKLDNCLPSSLTRLEIHASNFTHDINSTLSNLPNLEFLIFGSNSRFNKKLDLKYNTFLCNLEFGSKSKFTNDIVNAASTLKEMRLPMRQAIKIPNSVTDLQLEKVSNISLNNLLPINLVKLRIFSKDFNQPIELASTLEQLSIKCDNFNQDINTELRKLTRLNKLELGEAYTYRLDLPNTIRNFSIDNPEHPQVNLQCEEFMNNDNSYLYSGEVYLGDKYGNKIGECDPNVIYEEGDIRPGEWIKL